MKRTNLILAYLLPRLRDILFAGVCISFLVRGPITFSYDGDLGRHITVGNYILTYQSFPTHDVFSHTRLGERLVLHEWLADIIFAFVHRFMGLDGAVLLATLLAALTIWLVYEELIRHGNYRLVAVIIAVCVTMVSIIHWLARPHMFTFLLLAIWTYWLERFYTNDVRNIWKFPLLMLIWANLHGGFFAGFIIWGAYAVDWIVEYRNGTKRMDSGKQLASIGIFSFAATFINPFGWRLWTTTVGYVGNDFMTSRIVDHLSPNFHNKETWFFLLMIVLALLALMQDRKIHLREALLLAGWIAMGLHTIRNLPLFAVVTAPIYGSILQTWAEKLPALKKQEVNLQTTESFLRGYVWIVSTVLLLGNVLWRGIPLDEKGVGNVFLPDKMPVQAVDWLEQNPQQGNLFNDFAWGGYILYRLWPNETVFIDGQTDFYGETLFREYLAVISMNEGWERILDGYDVSWMLVPTKGNLARQLKLNQDDGWLVIYEDDTATILRRESLSP
jgi:hypothetical protein